MDNIKILLLCSSRFALPLMRDTLYAGQLSVVGIPDYCNEFLEEVQLLLANTSVLILQLKKDSFEDELKIVIKENQINLGFVATFPYKISSSLNTSITDYFFNIHPASLPEYRGADPVFQQIKNRDQYAGVTIHKLADKMDSGDIVIKERIKLNPTDTYGILNNKLAELAAKLAGIIIKMIALNIAIPSRPQKESKANYYKKQTSKDIIIKWNEMSAENIVALINACNPWNKGAVTKFNNKVIRLLLATEIIKPNIKQEIPGTVIETTEDDIIVSTINNSSLKIEMIYIDEGFLKAGKLLEFGFVTGNRFENIDNFSTTII